MPIFFSTFVFELLSNTNVDSKNTVPDAQSFLNNIASMYLILFSNLFFFLYTSNVHTRKLVLLHLLFRNKRYSATFQFVSSMCYTTPTIDKYFFLCRTTCEISNPLNVSYGQPSNYLWSYCWKIIRRGLNRSFAQVLTTSFKISRFEIAFYTCSSITI